MIYFEDYTNENKTEHNRKWSYIPIHPYRILIIGGSGSGKTNALLKLLSVQPDIDKIYLYAKDPYEAKYQYLINEREITSLKVVLATFLLVSFLCVKESNYQTKKSVFYFTSKALSVLEKIKF